MNFEYYIVDAFAEETFSGNPAAVYVLDEWLSDNLMQKIAIENNLSETAFTVKNNDFFELRWFTPDREINLCGHATLATAFVLFNYYGIQNEKIRFSTQSGNLYVMNDENNYYMDFPSIPPQIIEILPEYEKALGTKILEAYLARDLFFVLENEKAVENLTPNFSALKKLELGVGVIVTSRGSKYDFVSRTFFPKLLINEDPVCGSAHSNLIPYWSNILGITRMSAYQSSSRGGHLDCTLENDRIVIGGSAVLFSKGTAFINE